MISNVGPSNPFTGKWIVVSLYCNAAGRGWRLLKTYRYKSFVWEFTETGLVMFPMGTVVHSGILRELFRNHE